MGLKKVTEQLSPANDGRRLPRRRMNKFLRLTDRVSSQVLGRVMDMTTEGIMLISGTPLHQADVMSVSMGLPEDFEDGAVVAFQAKVVWTKKSSHSNNYATGLKIVSIDAKDKAVISRLIARMPKKSNE
ncbi:MAG: hypothetical protein COB04_03485 [Gammaproteobacteria bacterium]|nr:MAG: hypothetical protein COB04_03485 [Gammaproteobacteria bacterium]